jgi:polyhydroxyalkanoate synthesis regulator protein
MVPAREQVAVKLYGNRRLYLPALGRYVTRDELIALTHDGAEITVRDAQSDADLTLSILSSSPTEH